MMWIKRKNEVNRETEQREERGKTMGIRRKNEVNRETEQREERGKTVWGLFKYKKLKD